MARRAATPRSASAHRPLSFPKSARLLVRPDFLTVKERGSSFAEGPLAASWRPRATSAPTRAGAGLGGLEMKPAVARVGLTVSSKVGIAVVRNRVKRKLREAVRLELHGLPAVDLVVVARSSAVDADVQVFRAWLRKAARRMVARAETSR